ncbi:HIG1 domain family member 1A [Papilio machaon]|uniref:HIG1 domain family member 1A n=1 Tax=Papilio machaon TaxID=76193 RepID=A0A194RD06_PAPMA|nr:HIG1 domain family member 1A [Papilio machaon]
MAQQKPVFDYHEETHAERLSRKSKESPFMVFGLAGLASAVGYGVYSFRNRGKMSTSVYLMQFRVISQGIAVGAITVGMAYTLYNNHFNKPRPNAITGNVASIATPNEH